MQLLRKRVDSSFFESIDKVPYGIAIVDSVSGRIKRVNDAYCALLGRSRERIVGQPWMRFTHLDDVARDVYAIYQMYEAKAPQAYSRKRYIDGAGSVVPVDVMVSPLLGNESGKTHIVRVWKV